VNDLDDDLAETVRRAARAVPVLPAVPAAVRRRYLARRRRRAAVATVLAPSQPSRWP
jgi:hypothetical protein